MSELPADDLSEHIVPMLIRSPHPPDELTPAQFAAIRHYYYHTEEMPMPKTFEKQFAHLNYLQLVLDNDHEFLIKKDVEYGASWLKRGGVGAFMMLARKWDRLEEGVKQKPHAYDVYDFLKDHPDRIDDIQDLRRYLALVEAEWKRRVEDAALP
jgi:hypothetical protein